MFTLLLCLLIWLATHDALASDQVPHEKTLFDAYLEELAERKLPIVYSECQEKKDKVVLILPLGIKFEADDFPNYLTGETVSGGFFYLDDHGEPLLGSGSSVLLNKGKPILDDPPGGLWTIAYLSDRLLELQKYPFTFVAPDQFNLIARSKPKHTCAEERGPNLREHENWSPEEGSKAKK